MDVQIQTAEPVEHDILWSAEEIGAFVGLTPTQAIHKLQKGYLPGKKVGRLWISSKRKLRDVLSGI